jgi:hypothetical protein
MSNQYEKGIPVGVGEYQSPADFLLMSGFLWFEARRAPLRSRLAARRVLDEVLSSARAAGFGKGDLLETLMSKCEKSDRVWELAVEATNAVGDIGAFMAALGRAGVVEGDQE